MEEWREHNDDARWEGLVLVNILRDFRLGKGDSEVNKALKMHLSQRVKECAQLFDRKLLAKLSGREAIAKNLKYHPPSLDGQHGQVQDQKNALGKQVKSEAEGTNYSQASFELVTFRWG